MKETSPPVSAMATPTNGSGNLVDEFEEAFQHCLNVLTKEEAVPNSDKDEMKLEVDQTTLRFIDLARQMEAFFLQKRFLLSALKPEMVVKEDVNDLRLELARKDELLRRHYDKIAVWQNILSVMQTYGSKGPTDPISESGNSSATGGGGPQQPPPSTASNMSGVGGGIPSPMVGGGSGAIGSPSVSQMSGGSIAPPQSAQAPMMGASLPMQMQQQQQLQQQMAAVQQQQLQQQMAQQQLMQQQQQMQGAGPPNGGNSGAGAAVGGGVGAGGGTGMVSSQQALFLQQQAAAAAAAAAAMSPRGGPFSQQGPGGILQGPLAYLEKTTSNIGMADGRR